MNRRYFGRLLAGLGALQGLGAARQAMAADKPNPNFNKAPTVGDRSEAGEEELSRYIGGDVIRVGIVLYPGIYAQDVVGLVTVLQSLAGTQIGLLAKNMDPVVSGDPEMPSLINFQPTLTFDNPPTNLDVLVVPGSLPGRYNMLEDAELIAMLQKVAPTVKYVASVGTGALILGAAGLLKGYKATTYWPMRGMLKDVGATLVKKRVVKDRNRLTAAGTTASLDLGLALVDALRNPSQTKLVQLYLEYDPAPPYKGGTPETSPPEVTRFINKMYESLIEPGHTAAKEAMKRLKP